MNQLDYYFKVKKSDVSFICSYLEAFEGMCAIRTPNPKIGEDTVLHIMVSPDFNGQFEDIIGKLSKGIPMEKAEP
ncbi:MAG: DUF4911 domain-containing protein [bacterium]